MIPNLHIDGPEHKEEKLPDARLSSTNRNTFCGPVGLMSRVFCVNCGAPGGAVTEEWASEVFYLCDSCADKLGPLPCLQVPDAVAEIIYAKGSN